MTPSSLFHRLAVATAVAVGSVAVAVPANAQPAESSPAAATGPRCSVPPEFARFELPLTQTSRQIASGSPVKIVAIGSSSTFGAGASTPRHSYPSRLAAELAQEFVDHEFIVMNRGANGDIATGMIARFEADVIAERPDLVLWQVGTNSLLRGDLMYPHWSLLQGGIARLKAAGADVVLIDPQYAPRVLARPNIDGMLALMEQTARLKAVNLFRRFALMRHWHEVQRMPFTAFLSPDELHLNDFSYACVAHAMRNAIAEAAMRPIVTARAPSGRR